jgi:hypothetical protein
MRRTNFADRASSKGVSLAMIECPLSSVPIGLRTHKSALRGACLLHFGLPFGIGAGRSDADNRTVLVGERASMLNGNPDKRP